MFINRLPVLFIVSLCVSCITVNSVSINVTNGTIIGTQCSNPFTAVTAYLGIPYAQPPVGNLRWRAPLSYNTSYPNGTLNATIFSPSCYQFGNFAQELPPYSEDCLYLNVWAPINATKDSLLPVKVWIYGGSFYTGSSSDPLYNGCGLAATSIVVSMNYRIGPIGWLTLDSGTNFTGNYGILDILMSLQWIHENIASFGGNPNSVLLFGQSAGGRAAHIISTLPQAKGLISSVISESGVADSLPTREQQVAIGNNLAIALNCSAALDVGNCLRGKTPEEIVAATPTALPIFTFSPTRFYPYVDGDIIPIQPLATSPTVPFLAGSCSMDGTLFAISSFSNPLNVTYFDYVNYLNVTFGTNLVSSILSVYPISMFNSTLAPALYAISAVISDVEYICPTRRALTSSLPSQLGTFAYLWNHVPSCSWLQALSAAAVRLVGATHTSELAFVFNRTVQLPPPNGTCQLSAAEQVLSAEIVTAWESMAKNGYPLLMNGSRWPDWKQGGNGVIFTSQLTISTVNVTRCDFWDAIQATSTSTTTLTSTTSATNTTSPSDVASIFYENKIVLVMITIFIYVHVISEIIF